jgi:UDP-N-acetylglucosamine enolpyruvyl transferase
MRGSYYFLGALIGRCNRASVSMPGGCNFGVRPIDQHIKGFESLGATYPSFTAWSTPGQSAPLRARTFNLTLSAWEPPST